MTKCTSFICLACVALLTVDSTSFANQPPVTAAEYWMLVEETWALVAGLQGSQVLDVDRLQSAAAHWAAIREVVLSDGTRVLVDHGYLVSLLSADDPDVARLSRLLAGLRDARAAWPEIPTCAFDPDALNRILARPEFQWDAVRPSWLGDLVARFREWLARLLTGISGFVGQPVSRYVLTVLGVLSLGLALAYALRGVMTDLVSSAELDRETDGDDSPLTASLALRRAQALSEGKDYRSAVRYLYLSAILQLEERGLLRYDRSQTNREYLQSVSHLPQLANVLRRVVDVFERVWYGYQSIDSATYAHYEAQVRELEQHR